MPDERVAARQDAVLTVARDSKTTVGV